MRVIVVGLGVQGRKRLQVAGSDAVGTVDPVNVEATFRTVHEVPLDAYDGALVCVPDDAKMEILTHLLGHGKHVLVEKPLLAGDDTALEALGRLARANGAVCYTAYNHRFEPHFVRMRDAVASGALGQIYCARMFYGNGTARLVRDSAWRDQGAGVLPDLGSHLLDTALFWFGKPEAPFRITGAHCFENRAFDHVTFAAEGRPVLQMEMTLLSWRNHFTADVFGELGSAHIESLCKWGPSTFRLRRRMLPSGHPPEEAVTLVQADPTWVAEYVHWKEQVAAGGEGNLENDRWLNAALLDLTRQAGVGGRA